MDFNQMPEEVLELIILKCPRSMIPDLSLVCKRFNEVISESHHLMRSFVVYWDESRQTDTRPILKSKRKYHRVIVSSVSGIQPNLRSFFEDHKTTLTSISFNECSITSTQLKEVLCLVTESIETFALCEVNLKLDCAIERIKMQNLNWLEMMYGQGDGYGSVIQLFKGSSLDRFTYEDESELSQQNAHNFAEFLYSLKQLKKMSMSNPLVNKLFELQENLRCWQSFQLEKIFISIKRSSPEVLANIGRFLTQQKPTLETFTLIHCVIPIELLRIVLLLNLKSLSLVNITFSSRETIGIENSSIEEIFFSSVQSGDIGEFMISKVIESCQELKHVKFCNTKITFEMSMTMANRINLEVLAIRKCRLDPITYPQLKKLIIDECQTREAVRLIRVNRNLQTIQASAKFHNNQQFWDAVEEAMVREVSFLDY